MKLKKESSYCDYAAFRVCFGDIFHFAIICVVSVLIRTRYKIYNKPRDYISRDYFSIICTTVQTVVNIRAQDCTDYEWPNKNLQKIPQNKNLGNCRERLLLTDALHIIN